MELKQAAERIMENESLTGDLDDDGAKVLLEWTLARLPDVLLASADEEQANQYLHTLTGATRSMGDVIASRQYSSPAEIEVALNDLTERFRPLLPNLPAAGSPELAELAGAIGALDDAGAVACVGNWLCKPGTANA